MSHLQLSPPRFTWKNWPLKWRERKKIQPYARWHTAWLGKTTVCLRLWCVEEYERGLCVAVQGYGINSIRTSASPQEVKPLEGIYVHRVACGWGHTLLLARNDTDDDRAKLDDLPVFVP